jgi:hypothetical protein
MAACTFLSLAQSVDIVTAPFAVTQSGCFQISGKHDWTPIGAYGRLVKLQTTKYLE